MTSLLSWWPWRRHRAELQLPPPSLALLQARVKSVESSLQASRLREHELLEENIHLARQVAELGFRADRLQERIDACRCGDNDTKGRA